MPGIIYEPRGKAREYAALAANLYSGCGHQCVYCYAPDVVKKTREDFAQAKPRDRIIEKLAREAERLANSWEKPPGHILLCFTCDPYQPIDETYQLTRRAIEVLHHYGFRVSILTKGGHRAERDFDLLTSADKFGVTLTFLDPAVSIEWEPYAALPAERIDSLKKAHALGIPTWASLEPVLAPEESLEIIRQTYTFVDQFKVGILNYHPLGKRINWARFATQAVQLLDSLGCHYYLKRDLRRWLP